MRSSSPDSGEVVLTVGNAASGKPGQIEFAVSDTGIGLPSCKLEKIFDDYTQADASTTRKFGGTGLGLGISQRIVAAMGGRITAVSSAGEGSSFGFTAQFDSAPATARKVRVPLGDLAEKRVLLIDDNSTNLSDPAGGAASLGIEERCVPATRGSVGQSSGSNGRRTALFTGHHR